jgi:SecD/SecF fusion protein
MTGEAIAYSTAQQDTYGKPEILMRFTPAGRKRFAEVTREIAASGDARPAGPLAIVLDGTLCSVADRQGGDRQRPTAEITGSFTDREALNLANVLNNPSTCPSWSRSSTRSGPRWPPTRSQRRARLGHRHGAVAAFMITFYTTGGLVAVITLAVNLIIILGVMANIGATMTLPGLAGIVLTIGMAVDANILIFERMREELAAGKSLSTANQTASRRR